MQVFEFVMVLVSILIGLGLAELLSGVTRLLRSRPRAKIYWPHLCWVVTGFSSAVLIWWGRWELNTATEWGVAHLLLDLTNPVLLFLLAGLLFPEKLAGIDLRDHYYEQGPVFLRIASLVFLAGLAHEVLYEGQPWISPQTFSQVGGFLLTQVVAVSKAKLFHEVTAVVVVVGVLIYFGMSGAALA